MTAYASPLTNTNPVNTITGTLGDPFNTLEDAISKAYELGASKTSATITILLMAGPHAMLRNTHDYFMPSESDEHSQTTTIIIDT